MGLTLKNKFSKEYDIPYSKFAKLRDDIYVFLKQKTDQNPLEEGTLLFLEMADCDGKLSYKDCKQILKDIQEMPDSGRLYGYVGRGSDNCLTITKFKELLKDCASHRCNLSWC